MTVRAWPGLKKSIPFLIETSSDIFSSLVTIRKEWNKSLFPLLKRYQIFSVGDLSYSESAFFLQTPISNWTWIKSSLKFPQDINRSKARKGQRAFGFDAMKDKQKSPRGTYNVRSISKIAIEWRNYEVFSKNFYEKIIATNLLDWELL